MNAYDTPFKHRVSATPGGQFTSPFDAISEPLERAVALADMLETTLRTKELDDYDPGTLWRIAQTIGYELKDAQSIIHAFMDQKEAESQQVG